jgi:hypothetical protein
MELTEDGCKAETSAGASGQELYGWSWPDALDLHGRTGGCYACL